MEFVLDEVVGFVVDQREFGRVGECLLEQARQRQARIARAEDDDVHI